MTLSTAQEKALAIIPLFPAVVSIVSSSLLIRLVTRHQNQPNKRTTGNRNGSGGTLNNALPSNTNEFQTVQQQQQQQHRPVENGNDIEGGDDKQSQKNLSTAAAIHPESNHSDDLGIRHEDRGQRVSTTRSRSLDSVEFGSTRSNMSKPLSYVSSLFYPRQDNNDATGRMNNDGSNYQAPTLDATATKRTSCCYKWKCFGVDKSSRSSNGSRNLWCCCESIRRFTNSFLKWNPHRRILFVMSLFDIFNSVNVAWGPFLVPADTSTRVFAIGNDQTCSMIGFFFQASYPSFLYYGNLSLYYLLIIRFKMTDRVFSRKVEPWLHGVAIGYPIITAIVGLALGLYGELNPGPGCWLKSNDWCDDNCITLLEWLFGGIMFVSVWVFLIISNSMIGCHVRKTYQRSRRRMSLNNPSVSLARREQTVATQAFLYVIVFVLTYVWTLILRLVGNSNDDEQANVEGEESLESKYFPVMVLRAFFLPLMGFGNLLVYSRPRYLQRRARASVDDSRWRCFVDVVWSRNSANDSRQLKSSRESNDRGSTNKSLGLTADRYIPQGKTNANLLDESTNDVVMPFRAVSDGEKSSFAVNTSSTNLKKDVLTGSPSSEPPVHLKVENEESCEILGRHDNVLPNNLHESNKTEGTQLSVMVNESDIESDEGNDN